MSNKYNLPKIFKDNNPILKQYSNNVEFPLSKENLDIIDKMQTYLECSNNVELSKEYNLTPALGISAVQIGYLKNIFVINFKHENIHYNQVFINPKIISHNQQKCCLQGGEGCLSVSNGHKMLIYRYEQVTIKFNDMQNNELKMKFEGIPAIIVQHEMDHLIGVLYTDYLNGLVVNNPGINPKNL